jgi:hypothetical protein
MLVQMITLFIGMSTQSYKKARCATHPCIDQDNGEEEMMGGATTHIVWCVLVISRCKYLFANNNESKMTH